MRKLALLTLALALAAVACGDDDATSTTGSDTTSAPSTTSTTTSTTTTAATTTTVDATAARVAAAMEYAGTYTGEWRNTTFDSTGGADMSLEVDAATATAVLTLDLGGSVFGGGDPDPIVTEIDLSTAGPYAGTNDLFDDYTLEIDTDGVFTLTAPDISQLTGMSMVVEGALDPAGFDLLYTINHPAGGLFAEGTMTLAPVG